jgi:hypothetical protein
MAIVLTVLTVAFLIWFFYKFGERIGNFLDWLDEQLMFIVIGGFVLVIAMVIYRIFTSILS